MAFVEVDAVSKSFATERGARDVLADVTLSVAQGEFVCIVGGMGCGKSTLLNIVAGLVPPDAGEVRHGGEVVRSVRNGTAIVFQNYSLLPWLSALENVRLAVVAAFPDWPRVRQTEQARRYLEMVGLGNAVEKKPSHLSGGMRQRVAIARAFATEPSLLFLDDPFGALDALTRGNLQQELVTLSSTVGRSVTTVMITNSLEEALLLADRIVPMTHGPRASLGRPVTVDMARPRTADRLLRDEDAVRVRAHVVESLTASVQRPRRPNAARHAATVSDAAAVPSGAVASRSEA